jgi:hypothetical protein
MPQGTGHDAVLIVNLPGKSLSFPVIIPGTVVLSGTRGLPAFTQQGMYLDAVLFELAVSEKRPAKQG